tara:strand:+ start:29340 stop:30146 length:807 start_codon:yes stop_codon:yes gene_type:complete
MRYLKTKYERKAALLTTLLISLLLLWGCFFGLRYMDPPEEFGIAINFGFSDVGRVPQQQEVAASSPASTSKEQALTSENPVQDASTEDLLTQTDTSAPVLENKAFKDKDKTPEKITEKEVPKPSKETQSALSNLLNTNKSEDRQTKGEGAASFDGLQGNTEGKPKNSKYYGTTGNGGDEHYSLSGRSPLSRPIIRPKCNEEGTVVVSIEVDRSGKVIRATPGVKGTTNTAPCLLSPAKEAALRTQWNSDSKAPAKQVGVIVYRFSLSE